MRKFIAMQNVCICRKLKRIFCFTHFHFQQIGMIRVAFLVTVSYSRRNWLESWKWGKLVVIACAKKHYRYSTILTWVFLDVFRWAHCDSDLNYDMWNRIWKQQYVRLASTSNGLQLTLPSMDCVCETNVPVTHCIIIQCIRFHSLPKIWPIRGHSAIFSVHPRVDTDFSVLKPIKQLVK